MTHGPAGAGNVEEIAKTDVHADKVQNHTRDHERNEILRMEHNGTVRSDKHSANLHERPKKDGAGGKGTWGTWKDDVRS